MRTVAFPLLAALVLAPSLLSGQAPVPAPRRPLALEDYYRVKSVGSPRISPDGRWVSWTVSTPVEETNGDAVSTWLARADGSGEPVRVLHRGGDVTEPGWSEDGRLSYRAGPVDDPGDGGWLVDPASPQGPATARPAAPDGVPSPDGRWRASAREMPVRLPPEPALSDFERRHEDRFRGEQVDWYPFRQDGRPFPLPDRRQRPPRELFVEAADGSAPGRQLTRLGLEASDPVWTPDGSALVFTASDGFGDELAYGATDLWRVGVDGEITRLTDDGYDYGDVQFSPDGRWMSYRRSFSTDMIIELGLDHGGARDLFVVPAGGGEPVNLTATWDLDPGEVRWSPEGRWLYFTAGIGGESHLFRVAAPAGGSRALAAPVVEQVTQGERRIVDLDIDRAFRRMTYTVGELDRPEDVWVADIDGSNERRLSDVHADVLGEVELATRAPERVRWTSYDGTPVEGFLLFPHGYDPAGGPYPLVVMNHGGPHAASGHAFSFKNLLFAANGYLVFLPNFRSSTGYGDDFKWATWGAWGTKDGEDVMAGIDHLVASYGADRTRVGSTGHSYGGILTNWLITRYPDRFRAAIPGAGESNWTSNYALSDVARTKETEFFGPPWEPRTREIMIAQSPFLNSGGVKAATLFIHGEVDYRVPLEGSIQLYTSLKKQRVPTKLIIYEGMPHSISGHWNQVHRMMNELAWWERYLKPTGPVAATGR